jgi:hypothetical protein
MVISGGRGKGIQDLLGGEGILAEWAGDQYGMLSGRDLDLGSTIGTSIIVRGKTVPHGNP